MKKVIRHNLCKPSFSLHFLFLFFSVRNNIKYGGGGNMWDTVMLPINSYKTREFVNHLIYNLLRSY